MIQERIAIVGAGISGLSAAYYLMRRGFSPVLIEEANRTGGLIRTDHVNGCLLEAGPDSFLAAKSAVAELADDLGPLAAELIGSNDAQRRVFIVRGGKLVPMPTGMSMIVPGRLAPALLSDLFSAPTKLRIFAERFRRPMTRERDISVGELVADHFGEELVDYVAEPLLSGVYGGDARQLSAESVLGRFTAYEREFGSLIRAVQQERKAIKGPLFRSFAKGMQSLTDAVAGAIRSRCEFVHSEARSLEKTANGWRVRHRHGDLDVAAVIVGVPAHRAARLLASSIPQLADELAAIPYSSAILATFLYDTADFAHELEGFGFLVPPRERRTIAAATFINRKFPERIATGMVGIRVFIVGAEALALANAPENEIVELVETDLQRLLGIRAQSRTKRIERWPLSMPQYVTGHQARYARIRQLGAAYPNFALIGNAYEGVGIPDCIRLAKATAEAVASGFTSC